MEEKATYKPVEYFWLRHCIAVVQNCAQIMH